MDRFSYMNGIIQDAFDYDMFIGRAMESHLADLREMDAACEAFNARDVGRKIAEGISGFMKKAGTRIMEIIDAVLKSLSGTITRIGNLSSRKSVDVPQPLVKRYEDILAFMGKIWEESGPYVDNIMNACDPSNFTTGKAFEELIVANAKLRDFNHEMAEKIGELGKGPDGSASDYLKESVPKVPFEPAKAQKEIDITVKHWRGIQSKLKTRLGPGVNVANINSAVAAFVKGEEGEDLNKGAAQMKQIINGSYSSMMTLCSTMLKMCGHMSSAIASMTSFGKKFVDVDNTVEGNATVRDAKEHKKEKEPAQDRVKALSNPA